MLFCYWRSSDPTPLSHPCCANKLVTKIWALSQFKTYFRYGFPLWLYHGRESLILIMGNSALVRRHIYVVTVPGDVVNRHNTTQHNVDFSLRSTLHKKEQKSLEMLKLRRIGLHKKHFTFSTSNYVYNASNHIQPNRTTFVLHNKVRLH